MHRWLHVQFCLVTSMLLLTDEYDLVMCNCRNELSVSVLAVTSIRSTQSCVIDLLLQGSSVSIPSRNPMVLHRLWSLWNVRWRTLGVDSFFTSFVQMLLVSLQHPFSCCTQCHASTLCRRCSISAGLSSPAAYDVITSTFFQRRLR